MSTDPVPAASTCGRWASQRPAMVALGDSYASGVGSSSYYPDSGACYRSPAAYPVQIAVAAGLQLDLQACLGAMTADLDHNQLPALSASTGYVTITVGGNDLNFIPVLTECAKPDWWGDCNGKITESLGILKNELPDRLRSTYASITDRAPNAKVVVTGYPLLFNGADCSALTFFSPAEEQRLNDAADLLNDTILALVLEAGFTFADPRPPFAGHAVCDRTEYIHGVTIPLVNSYHPNTAGHTAYAELVAPLLGLGGPASARRPGIQVNMDSSSAHSVSAGTFVFTPPDLNSTEALLAARRAGISEHDLNRLRSAQAAGMSSTKLHQLDRQIADRARRR